MVCLPATCRRPARLRSTCFPILTRSAAQIWVIVDDNTANGHDVVSNSFMLAVLPLIYGPTIGAISDQTVSAGRPRPRLAFRLTAPIRPRPP